MADVPAADETPLTAAPSSDEAELSSEGASSDAQPSGTGSPDEAAVPSEPQTRAMRRAAREAADRPRVDPATLVATSPVAIAATLGLGLLVVVSALSGQAQTGLALAFVGVVLAWGWPTLLDAPSPLGSSVVIAGGALAIAGAAGLTQTDPFLRWVPVAASVSMIAGFLHQLLRRDGRTRLTYGVTTTISGLALVTAGAPIAVLPAYGVGGDYVLVAGAALALAALVELLGGLQPTLQRWMFLPVVVVSPLGAVVVAAMVHGIPLVAAAIIGLLVGAISHTLRRVLSPLPGAASLQGRVAIGAASVLGVGVVVYLLMRLYAA